MFTLPVGNRYIPHIIKDRGCRTQAQFEAVKKLVPEIDFSCNNPFKADSLGEEYICTFAFIYYSGGELHLANITPTGRIKHKSG